MSCDNAHCLPPPLCFLPFLPSILLSDCCLSPLQVEPLPFTASKQQVWIAQMPGLTHCPAQAAALQGLQHSSSLAVLETPYSYEDLAIVLSGFMAPPSPLRPCAQQHVLVMTPCGLSPTSLLVSSIILPPKLTLVCSTCPAYV